VLLLLLRAKRRLYPHGTESLVLGFSISAGKCYRLVDRGPPADDLAATSSFLDLWGNEKAELRCFKGVIVHAVVWGTVTDDGDVRNDDKVQGEL
jgi:hypothetical protein